MAQKHLFILDPMARLNLALDSSLQMALELHKRGHRVYQTESQQISWSKGEPCSAAMTREMSFPGQSVASVEFATASRQLLHAFDGIHMRKEPPFNMDYIATTWLLDSAVDSTWIFNHPGALRSVNEKLSIFLFPESANPALVSSNGADLMTFYQEIANRDAIVKPLDMFGGRGIFRLNRPQGDDDQALSDLMAATENGVAPRLIQKFDPSIYQGEVRVFTLGGQAISWCLKVPAPGNFLANTSQGAVLKQYTPSENLRQMVEAVAGQMCKMGIYLAGFDIIGDRLSEINITSPRLLRGQGDSNDYYGQIADWFVSKCAHRPDAGRL